MKVVYLAGSYRSDTEYGVHRNIQRAEQVALEVWRLGAACLCPHKNTAYFGGALPDSVWLEGYLELVRRSDAVLVLAGSERSKGTAEEVVCATLHKIPVFRRFYDLGVWLTAGEAKALQAVSTDA